MLGEGRRIQNDEVVGILLHLLEEAESILRKSFVTGVAGEVQLHIGVDEVHGLGRTVHGMYEGCASAHGIDREAARVAEHVQHVAPGGVALQEAAVVPLVHEEARLLAAQPVDVESQTVLHGHVIRTSAQQEAVLLTESGLERQRGLALVEDVLQALAHDVLQGLGHLLAHHVHAYAMSLHDGRGAIDIDDQPRQVVALAVDQSEGVVLRIVCHPHAPTGVQRHLYAAAPESVVDGFLNEREHAHGDAADLPMSYGDEFALGGEHTHEVSLGRLLFEVVNGPGEDPGMEAAQGFVLAALEIDICHDLEVSGSGTSTRR